MKQTVWIRREVRKDQYRSHCQQPETAAVMRTLLFPAVLQLKKMDRRRKKAGGGLEAFINKD